jgi:hypothetical protein
MNRMQTAVTAVPMAGLAAAYPAWHIWRGRDSRGRDADWYATRRRRLTAREAAAGLRLTVSAATPDSLRDLLEQQQVIEGRLGLTAIEDTR